jgi:hypothetical protein
MTSRSTFLCRVLLEGGPPPTEDQLPVPAVDQVIAFDQARRQIAQCRLSFGLSNTC